jgi:hypothetical protein
VLPIAHILILASGPHRKFRNLNDLVEPIMDARGADAGAILHQKMDFIVTAVAASMNEDLRATPRSPPIRPPVIHLVGSLRKGLAALCALGRGRFAARDTSSEHPAKHTLRQASCGGC